MFCGGDRGTWGFDSQPSSSLMLAWQRGPWLCSPWGVLQVVGMKLWRSLRENPSWHTSFGACSGSKVGFQQHLQVQVVQVKRLSQLHLQNCTDERWKKKTCLGDHRKTAGIDSCSRKPAYANICGWGTSHQWRPEPDNKYKIKYLCLITSRGDVCVSPLWRPLNRVSLLFSPVVPMNFRWFWVGQ